jgi:hypothetical protein
MFRKDTSERLPVDINGIILTVLAIVRIDLQKNDVELQTQLDERVSVVEGDKVQLQQVVLNLVMNAIEAMQSVRPRVLKVKSEQSKPEIVHVSFEDIGTGIDPSNLNRVFSPLFTTKERGMGMGLSICHSIIENHNGRIWVSPGVTRGSIFQFELPTKSDKHKVGTMRLRMCAVTRRRFPVGASPTRQPLQPEATGERRSSLESPVTLHAERKAGQLVTDLVKSILNHAARPAPRRLIVGLAGCPPTKPLGLDTLHRAREQLQQNPGIIGHREPLFYLKSVADRQVEA